MRATPRSAGWARRSLVSSRAPPQLAIDARTNLDPLVALIDQSQPVLDSQVDTSGRDPRVGGALADHHPRAANP